MGRVVACCKVLVGFCKDIDDLPFLLPPNTRGQRGNIATVLIRPERGKGCWRRMGGGLVEFQMILKQLAIDMEGNACMMHFL
jgi:hypothetical protein